MGENKWQEYTFHVERAPGLGYGIAIGGGRDNPAAATGDPSIVVTDVIRQGPANDKLKVDDIVTRVNGKPTFNMEHRQAIKELKNCGQRVELTIRRKVRSSTPPRGRSSRNRDYHSLPRPRSRDRDYDRGRYRARSKDFDDSRRRRRSRSRDGDKRRSRRHSRSRSRNRSPPRGRGRSYSRSPSHSRDSSPSYRRGRSRSPDRRRTKSRTPSRSDSFSTCSSASSPRRDSPPRKMEKYKPVEDLRGSPAPLSLDPEGAVADDNMMVFPVEAREPKTVVLMKTRWNNSYGLKLGTRIFIQDIQPGSLAAKNPEIAKGDTVLMINGRNVDNKTVDDAIRVIASNKDKVTMLVKKDGGGTVSLPADRFLAPESAKERRVSTSEVESHHSASHHSPSRKSSTSKESVGIEEIDLPSESPKVADQPVKKQFGGVRVLPSGLADPPTRSSSSSSSSLSAPKPAPRSTLSVGREYSVPPGPEEDDGSVLPPAARQVVFVKDRNVGIRLAGGNDVGIFVASVQDGSSAAKQGLKTGDKIFSVNDVSFRNVIREEAVLTLMGLSTGKEVRIIAEAQPEIYKKIVERGTGDSFYIRTHFKYEKSGGHEMSFRPGATFLISDTLYQGMVGYWLALRIGRNQKEIERGVIPNSSRAEQLKMVQDKKRAQLKERNNRGISRRLIKSHKTDTTRSSSSTPSMFPAYEKVVLREAGFKRPVVIFGPLADIARERLAGDYPNLYQIAGNEGMVRGQKSNRKGVIRLNTIKDVILLDKHAILDITPTAVEKLNYAQLYPIVVFLEAPSKSAVKDLRQKLATTDQEKKKKAGKLYDGANKLHRGYGHVFTDLIKLTAGTDDWYTKLNFAIKDQQSMPVWVSKDKLGVSPEEAEEGVMTPGDDDQFSYVSAPASDYSVTTVGSEFNNSGILDEEDKATPKDFVKPKLRASTSSQEEVGNKFDDSDFGDALSPSDDESLSLDQPVPPHAAAEPESSSTPSHSDEEAAEQPPPVSSSSSSSSEDEEESAVAVISPQPPQSPTRIEPSRGSQKIPPGRFDPQSFLKSHIKGLTPVGNQEEPRSPPPVANQPQVSPVKVAPLRSEPSVERASVDRPEPQQPVYAQVNKRSKPQESQMLSPNRREPRSPGFSGGMNHEPRARPSATPQDARPAPARQQPTHHVSPSHPKPTSTYNRFAGSTQPKPYQPYNPPARTSYQRPPVVNGTLQKSKFQQEKYKDYMNQIKPAQAGSSYSNPRPYSKPGPKMNNRTGSQEHMYDSGVDAHDGAKPKKDAQPLSPSFIDENDPEVVANARGVFDSNGGVLSSVETGVSIVIPKGAILPGRRQEIYFKVCRDNSALPPLDKDRGETLLSPLVMCGPHGLQFEHPVELRLPHCASMTSDSWSFALKTSDPGEPSQWQDANGPNESNNYDVGSNSVSVLIDHF